MLCPAGADLLLCLLGRRAALEQALEMQRGRATELQARLDSRGAHLQIEIERLREEEVSKCVCGGGWGCMMVVPRLGGSSQCIAGRHISCSSSS
eukprot:scaffold7688_cov130-Isochrysis_galbana.AAC.16